MHVTRFGSAPAYESPGHADMKMFRLQGREAGPSESLWLGLSHLLPGGGTTFDASTSEKIYVVINGQLVITNGEQEETLGPLDSCRIAPGEGRQLINRTNHPVTVLLAMPLA